MPCSNARMAVRVVVLAVAWFGPPLRTALQALPVHVAGHAVVNADAASARVCKHNFPDARHFEHSDQDQLWWWAAGQLQACRVVVILALELDCEMVLGFPARFTLTALPMGAHKQFPRQFPEVPGNLNLSSELKWLAHMLGEHRTFLAYVETKH
eukprot:5158954-Amphidinium_carterae.1